MTNTTNAWDRATKLADKHSNQGGIFIRLTNNHDKIIGAFCGEPYSREVVWVGEKYETYDSMIHTGKRPSLRIMINFYVPAEGSMKVMEGSTVWFKDLLKVRDKYGLDKWLFEIERHGEPRDPKTKYTILPEEKIDATTHTRINDTQLHDLAALVEDAQEEKSEPSTGEASAQVDLHIAKEIMERLKELPRSDAESFMSKLGLRRLRDLAADDVATARELLSQLEAQQQHTGDVDPFAL